MFVSYIPDESAGLCYAVGVLSSPTKIPGTVVKVIPKRHSKAFQLVSQKDVSAQQQALPSLAFFLSTRPFMFVF